MSFQTRSPWGAQGVNYLLGCNTVNKKHAVFSVLLYVVAFKQVKNAVSFLVFAGVVVVGGGMPLSVVSSLMLPRSEFLGPYKAYDANGLTRIVSEK